MSRKSEMKETFITKVQKFCLQPSMTFMLHSLHIRNYFSEKDSIWSFRPRHWNPGCSLIHSGLTFDSTGSDPRDGGGGEDGGKVGVKSWRPGTISSSSLPPSPLLSSQSPLRGHRNQRHHSVAGGPRLHGPLHKVFYFGTQFNSIPVSYQDLEWLMLWKVFAIWPWCQKINSTKPNVFSLLFQIIFILGYLDMVEMF